MNQDILKAKMMMDLIHQGLAMPLMIVTTGSFYDHEWGMSSQFTSEEETAHAMERAREDGCSPSNWAELVEYLYDSCDEPISVELPWEAEDRRRSQERRELDSYVSMVVQAARIDATDINAVLDELSRIVRAASWREEGLREDGLCATSMGFGGGQGAVDEYYDLVNDCRAGADKADRAIQFIAEQSPLAYMFWESARDAGED